MPNKEFEVGGTVYEFPDDFSDEKVQGILTKQGVIKPPANKGLLATAREFSSEHPYVTAAASLLPGGNLLFPRTASEVGRGALKAGASDAATLLRHSSPPGEALGYLADKTGITKRFDALTERDTPAEQVGGVAAGIAEMAVPIPGMGSSKTVDRLGKSLSGSAQKGYSQVLNATTRGNKIRSAEVVPELIDRGVTALTLKGLGRKTAEGLATATEKLENAYAGLPADASIPAEEVVKSLAQRARETFTVNGKAMSPQSDTALALAKELGERLLGQATKDATGKNVITVDVARKTRQIYDEISAAAGRFEGKALADHSASVVHGMAADSIRELLNKVSAGHSTIGEINREYNFWKKADTVIQDTLMRRQGQARPLGQKILAGAGAAAGLVHGGPKGAALGYEAMRAVEAATTSAAWRTTSAVAKDRLAKAIASGNDQAASAIAKGIALGYTRSQ